MKKNTNVIIAKNLASWMRSSPELDTQLLLSQRVGVGQTNIHRLLKGDTNPTIFTLEIIAEAYGKSLIDIISDTENVEIDYPRKRYEKLPEFQKKYISDFIFDTIETYENRQKKMK